MSDFPTPEQDKDQTAHGSTESSEQSQISERRRVLKAGLVTPVVLTIISQPALGCTNTCFAPSKSLSKNTSLTQKKLGTDCEGISPGNYKSQLDPSQPSYNWPNTVPTNRLFTDVFNPVGPCTKQVCVQYSQSGTQTGGHHHKSSTSSICIRSETQTMTLLDVLNMQGNQDPNKVAFHMVGAYLNVMSGKVHFLPSQQAMVSSLREIWSEYATRGFYEPVAGVQWGGSQIVGYLQNNNIAP